jgi:hypothetical protein
MMNGYRKTDEGNIEMVTDKQGRKYQLGSSLGEYLLVISLVYGHRRVGVVKCGIDGDLIKLGDIHLEPKFVPSPLARVFLAEVPTRSAHQLS